MSCLAIITARGGSKRIPRKNIKEFMGKPMLAYAIDATLKSGLFDEVMVSTDDIEIADIAKKYGAKVPFMRSEKTANDFATTADVLKEVVSMYDQQNKHFDDMCCVYPCVPFLTSDLLKSAFENYKSAECDSLTPVVKFSYPIQRALKVISGKYLTFREPEYARTRSQDLEPMYHDVGMFYFYNIEKFKSNSIKKTILYEMDERYIQDIDTLDDWKMAELKYKMLNMG